MKIAKALRLSVDVVVVVVAESEKRERECRLSAVVVALGGKITMARRTYYL